MSETGDSLSPEEKEALTSEFLSEGGSYLHSMNEKLVEAETAVKSGKGLSEDLLHEMFRLAHNIKGMAAFVGLPVTVKITHEMETVMQKLRNKELPASAAVFDVLFLAFDALGSQFASLKSSGKEAPEEGDAVERLRAIQRPAQASLPKRPQVQDKINQKYLAKLIEDTESAIDNFNLALLEVEKGNVSPQIINELFRLVHTIKGSAGLVGAARVESIAHSMENILAALRDKKAEPSDQVISLLFAGIDAVKDVIDIYKSDSSSEYDVGPICAMMDRFHKDTLSAGAAKPADAPKQPEKEAAPAPQSAADIFEFTALEPAVQQACAELLESGRDVFGLMCEVEQDIPIKSLKVMILEERVRKRGRLLHINPASDAVDDSLSGAINVNALLSVPLNEKEIRKLLNVDGVKLKSIERLERSILPESFRKKTAPVEDTAKEPASAPKADMKGRKEMTETTSPADEKTNPVAKHGGIELSTIRIDAHKLDTLMNLSGELVIVRARFSQLLQALSKEGAAQREFVQAFEKLSNMFGELDKDLKTLGAAQDNGASLKSRLTGRLRDCKATLDVVAEKMVKNSAANSLHSLDEMTSALGKISGDIQSGVMQARMVPIEGIFTRFKRIVRDISKELSKDVNLIIEGEETELDRKIVDSLGDPLTHMIRNAVDHAIEDTEARRKSGKPQTGTIILRASHKGNNIWIEVIDDGRGVDAAKVSKSAIAKNVITEAQAAKMSEKDKLNLIFLPGFSTAEKVTGLSGRGVGMDVVKSVISSVNGTIDIETEVGKGTRFILKIPLTMAIIKALLVKVGGEIYACPVDCIMEIVKVDNKDIYSIDGYSTIKLRDHALSLVNLQNVLKIKAPSADSSCRKVVVITDGDKHVGVEVDSLLGEEEIVIKSLTDHFSGVKGITGASLLGDGSIALILDPISIIGRSRVI